MIEVSDSLEDEQLVAPPAPVAVDIVQLQADLAQARERASELEQSAQYWHEQSKSHKPAAAAAAGESDVDEEDMLAISAQGPKALRAWMAKQGFIDKDTAAALVTAKAKQLTSEAQLTGEYPELKDQSSDFFKATAKHYQALISQGVPESSALSLAAQKVELEGLRSGKRTAVNKETNRLQRIAAQGGSSSRTVADASGESDDVLDAHQLRICESMGIDPAAYILRAKTGVQMARKGK